MATKQPEPACPFQIMVEGEPDPELAVQAVLTLLGLRPGQDHGFVSSRIDETEQ